LEPNGTTRTRGDCPYGLPITNAGDNYGFDGSAIKALLDDAVSRGAVHGIAAVVVDRNGPLFHHAAGEAGEHAMFRNALMTKAVATTVALQFVEA
jgi:methyl acetate hydrolase